jgi:hypothetical protein
MRIISGRNGTDRLCLVGMPSHPDETEKRLGAAPVGRDWAVRGDAFGPLRLGEMPLPTTTVGLCRALFNPRVNPARAKISFEPTSAIDFRDYRFLPDAYRRKTGPEGGSPFLAFRSVN